MKAEILKGFKQHENIVSEGDIVDVVDWTFDFDGTVEKSIAAGRNDNGSFDLFKNEYRLIDDSREVLKFRIKRLKNYSKKAIQELRLIILNIIGRQL